MRGHVVATFDRVSEIRRAVRDCPIQVSLEIAPHARISILVNRQRSGRVLHEKGREPDVQLPEFRKLRQELLGNEMKAARPRPQPDDFLQPHEEMHSSG